MRRRRILDTEAIVKGLLQLAGTSQSSYVQALDQLACVNTPAPAASSFCEARAKLPAFVVGEIRRDVLDVWDDVALDERWHGFRLHAVDGTKVALPRTLFQYGFKAPASGYCPQGLVSLLFRLSDKMVCDVRLSSHENERVEAHEHLAHLSAQDLVIYDRGYLSFGLLTAHVHQGIQAIFRVSRGNAFKPIARFWKSQKRDEIVTISPTSVTYRNAKKQFPEYDLSPVQVRLIKYSAGNETYVLATTILEESIPWQAFVEVYAKRWQAEEVFKALKQSLELESFHSKSHNGIEQEVEAHAFFWNLARIMGSMADALIKKNDLAA